MPPNEYSPYEHFSKLIGFWWLVALATFLGGVCGFIFYQLQPPEYEATATYIVTIDLNRFPFQGVREDLVQYNEDMAVNSTQNALLSRDVQTQLIAELKQKGISMTQNELLKNYTIERKQDVWELRFRSEEPNIAQDIVDTWANFGYEAMLSWQKSGKAPVYVTFNPPTLSVAPVEPVVYDRNKTILAGAMIGFIVGVITASLLDRSPKKSFQEDE
jgi:hypothetical protein